MMWLPGWNYSKKGIKQSGFRLYSMSMVAQSRAGYWWLPVILALEGMITEMRHLIWNTKWGNWLLALLVIGGLIACSQSSIIQTTLNTPVKNITSAVTTQAGQTFSLQSLTKSEEATDLIWLEGEFAVTGLDWVRLIGVPAENQPQRLSQLQDIETGPYPIRLTTNRFKTSIGWVSNENEIMTLKINASAAPMQIAEPDFPVTGLALNPAGDELVYAALDGSIVRVGLAPAAQAAAEWQAPHWLANLSYSPDGKQIGGADLAEFKVYIYELDGSLTSTLEWQGAVSPALYGVHFSPDWKTLAWVNGSVVQLMNLNTGKETYLLSHEDAVSYAIWSPHGSWFATASAANIGGNLTPVVDIWRQSNGELAASFPQDSPIQSLSFSPDGSKISVLDANSTVRIFALPDQ
ncbi:MAG: hypothetical protein B6D39_03455 [Anaerolineae bacterium UTCFX2]|jgi:WD40 repeat protein|nr:MAG: hypothetical protein B6D39_03455 [Anaerolineae bacterium UTCFX2]